jgi:hypothetical protein
MTKLFLVLFGVLTIGSLYLTVNDVGVMEPTITKHTARQGSVHRGGYVGTGYRRGK